MGQMTIRKPALSEFPSWTAPSDFSPRDSWHYDGWANDACPKWIVQLPTGAAVLWVEFADPDVRDTECPHLYSLCVYNSQEAGHECPVTIVTTVHRKPHQCYMSPVTAIVPDPETWIGPVDALTTDAFSEILSRLEELGASL
mgnify:CR=1 FL=1